METIFIKFIMILIALVLVVLFFIPKKHLDKFEFLKQRERLELIYFITAILTIISIFLALWAYYEDRGIQEDNKRILMENTIEELRRNLILIDDLNNKNISFIGNITLAKFRYTFLEDSLTSVKNSTTRKEISQLIDAFKQGNDLLDYMIYDTPYADPSIVKNNLALNQFNKKYITPKLYSVNRSLYLELN